MAASSPWPLIHAEREALAADLATLTAEQWATPSLCSEWTVRDAFGHIIATAKITPPAFFAAMAKAGFRFNTMNANRIAAEATATPAEALAEFRRLRTATTHPPGPVEAMVGEAVIHGEDIRRPLGIKRQYLAAAVIRVADFNKGSNLLIGSKRRIAGLALKADDADWQTGAGPEVTGPLLSLVLAMTGRATAVGDLSGAGVETLRSRM
jgi:uncharacterized protein (TIGR03083 family)